MVYLFAFFKTGRDGKEKVFFNFISSTSSIALQQSRTSEQ
jgi:hypothetical protein